MSPGGHGFYYTESKWLLVQDFREAGRGRVCGGGGISVFPHSAFSTLFKTCFVYFRKVGLTAISYPGVRRELLY